MTGAQPLIYNCFIIRPCSPDNNGVCGVFLIMWHFFALVIKDFRFPLIALKIMTASALASSARSLDVSLLDCITNSLSVSLESREDGHKCPDVTSGCFSCPLLARWFTAVTFKKDSRGVYQRVLSLYMSIYLSIRLFPLSVRLKNLNIFHCCSLGLIRETFTPF